jgi:hypothetical protein
LGVETSEGSDITNLVHVRSRAEIKAAEEVTRRAPCPNFAEYKPIFEQVQQGLASGARQTVKFGGDYADIKQGDLFILEGQKVLVVAIGESFVSEYERLNRRLHVVYDNGTESEPLLRSLQRALYEDKTSRRITKPGFGPLSADIETHHEPLFSEELEEGDLATGYIYVLRSQSDHPFVAEHRSVLHKIGVTGSDVKSRFPTLRKTRPISWLMWKSSRPSNLRMSTARRLRLYCPGFLAAHAWTWSSKIGSAGRLSRESGS